MTNETLSAPPLTKSMFREACSDLLIDIAVSEAKRKILKQTITHNETIEINHRFIEVANKISKPYHYDEAVYVFSKSMVEAYADILYAEAFEVGTTKDSVTEIANHFKKEK